MFESSLLRGRATWLFIKKQIQTTKNGDKFGFYEVSQDKFEHLLRNMKSLDKYKDIKFIKVIF